SLDPLSKDGLGISSRDFTFLFCFNFLSFSERKNPRGLIRAFRKAFSKDEPVSLIIKSMGAEFFPAKWEELDELAQGAKIRMIDGTWKSQNIVRLMKTADCYVSLHRCEGFGLTMLEAMALGKPVIASRYSGNLDFMTPSNGFLVPVKIVEIERDN